NLARVPRAAAMLVDAADETAAQALVAFAYAIDIGDPDGAALLPGDVSRRHDFGFGQRDTEQRLRAAWMMPLPDVAPGVPWHVDGSLLGLDVALAPIALRRLNSDQALEAPTLTSNDRETFAVSFGLMNPFALTDTARDGIAGAIERPAADRFDRRGRRCRIRRRRARSRRLAAASAPVDGRART